jgi:hypothetical protein
VVAVPVPAARVVVPRGQSLCVPRRALRLAPRPLLAALLWPVLGLLVLLLLAPRAARPPRVSRSSFSHRKPVLLLQRVVAAPPQAQYEGEGQTSSKRARA